MLLAVLGEVDGDGDVPRMAMPAASSSWAMRNGVWPPTGHHALRPLAAQMLATSSKVSGSK